MTVWTIDPGESVGWCVWENDGSLYSKGKYTVDQVMSILSDPGPAPDTIIVEQWAFDPGKTQRGNKMISSQVIGMFRLFAHMKGAELIFQDRRVLKIAALHADVEIPKNGHFDDDVSAYLHGFYYFETKGLLEPKSL